MHPRNILATSFALFGFPDRIFLLVDQADLARSEIVCKKKSKENLYQLPYV